MENIRERRLRLWKTRQEAEGYDVSKVKTLEEAEHFFDAKRKKKPKKDQNTLPEAPVADNGNAVEEAPEILDEEETTDEQCDIDPVDEPV